jgi:hypothetical protein
MSWRTSRNPVGDFNTQGQDKCPYCGDHFPEAWSINHINTCHKKPKEDDD